MRHTRERLSSALHHFAFQAGVPVCARRVYGEARPICVVVVIVVHAGLFRDRVVGHGLVGIGGQLVATGAVVVFVLAAP